MEGDFFGKGIGFIKNTIQFRLYFEFWPSIQMGENGWMVVWRG